MGRRALPKIDPSVPLERHLLPLEGLDSLFRPEALFGRDAPLEVEVGSGKGLFLLNQSQRRPETDFLGVEVRAKYARFAAYRLAQAERPNAKLICGDALLFFERSLPDASVEAVHVYFPDPWWKAKHSKRRIFNEPFLRDVTRVLKPGGQFHFWTDVEEYFESGLELIAQLGTLIGPIEVAEQPAEHDMDYRTHFERRTRKQNLPVYRSRFEKPETA